MASDEECFGRFRDGDEGAFETLLDRYRRPLFSFILRMVGHRGDAEDIFQETFIRVLHHRGDYDPRRPFGPWLYTIAANLVRDERRKRWRRPEDQMPESLEFPGAGNPEADSMARETGAKVDRAVAALPAEQREVFLLREQAGLSFKEIAEATGANLNTVLGRMHLAVKKLRADLAHLEPKE